MKNIRKRPNDNQTEDEHEGKSKLHSAKKTTMPKPLAFAESTNNSKNVYFQYESCKEFQVQNDSRATATLETETDLSGDARASRKQVPKQQKEEAAEGKNKVYKGICHYTDYRAGFRREQNHAGGVYGPQRASAHIRVTSRFDYQPDICKDYKKTGNCGYGDSCKFLHDRGDYKSGWEMEKEWEEAQKARKRDLSQEEAAACEDEEEGDQEESVPSVCSICRQPFVDPVVTVCKHYFCGTCALKHHSRNRKCFVCDQPTEGTFNIAREIRKRMGGSRR